MKFIGLLVVALALALAPTVAVAPSAHARYGSGSFTVKNAQHLSSGCYYHPYAVNLNITGASYWDVDIRILAPNGSIADLNYISGTGSGAASFPEETFLCSSLDAPGTYKITGKVTTYDYYYGQIAEAQMIPASFQVLAYTPPAPPPPPPAPVYADVTGSVSHKMVTRGVKFTFKSDALPPGATLRNALKWKVVAEGRVRASFTQGPSNIRTKTIRFAAGTGRHVVKVLRHGIRVKTVSFRT